MSKSTVSHTGKTTGTQKDIINYGMKYLNTPYRYAAKGPHAFDCSGFTSFVFREFGYRLSTSSAGQDKQVPNIENKEDLRVGDLVFFEGNSRNSSVGHVGIVSEILPDGEFRFLHASTSYGVIVSRSTEEYYAARYLRGGRVLKENNQVVIANKTKGKKPVKEEKREANKKSFSVDKANQQVLVKAPKTLTEKEIEITTEPDMKENSSMIIHTRPFNTPISGPAPEQQNKHNVELFVSKDLRRSDSITVPQPIESDIDNSDFVIHDVAPAETLYSISRKYNCSVEQLRKWNPHLGNILKSGERLKIHQ